MTGEVVISFMIGVGIGVIGTGILLLLAVETIPDKRKPEVKKWPKNVYPLRPRNPNR